MNNEKIKLGQFFTKESLWLKPQIFNFIINSKCDIAYDPFAGQGDLLNVAKDILNFKTIKGLDIDEKLKWEKNDSLLSIPTIKNAIIITNPPYIAKHSASRKNIDLSNYFLKSEYDDIYLIALDRIIKAQQYSVAIIPESFINSNFKNMNLVSSITIIEQNPFTDTEVPICVVCFDGIDKDFSKIKIYNGEKYLDNLQNILNNRKKPKNNIEINFNDKNGWLGLRAIDSSNSINFITFDFKEKFNYDWERKVKISSRNFSLIYVDIPVNKRIKLINKCNEILLNIREKSYDVILTPFKGNNKNGVRRRRLDFKLARWIIEKSIELIDKE